MTTLRGRWSALARATRFAAAVGGPLVAAATCAWVIITGDGATLIYFVDDRGAAAINVWLAASLAQDLWGPWRADGRRSPERLGIAGPRSERLVDATARWTQLAVFATVGVLAGSLALRLPLTVTGGAVVAVAIASVMVLFETIGDLVDASGASVRRSARLIVIAAVASLALFWVVPRWGAGAWSAALGDLIAWLGFGEPWRRFAPARWILRLVEAIAVGRHVTRWLWPPVVCAAIAITARVAPRPPDTQEN